MKSPGGLVVMDITGPRWERIVRAGVHAREVLMKRLWTMVLLFSAATASASLLAPPVRSVSLPAFPAPGVFSDRLLSPIRSPINDIGRTLERRIEAATYIASQA